ncbi:deoxynucleoside kinase family protein, partial [Chlamydia psittaci 02DC14]
EKKYLEAYDALFSKLISKEELPDFAIYLDITFDTFKKRIFERGRESEINN